MAAQASSKKVVIDTNVILFDSLAVTRIRNADIYIPLCVIEEVDQFKRDHTENGRNARHFSRFIDKLRNQGPLSSGIALEKSDSKIYVNTEINKMDQPFDLLHDKKADNLILGAAAWLKKEYPKNLVELITKDVNLRIKADVLGLVAKDYEPDDIPFEELYKGFKTLEVSSESIAEFYRDKCLSLKDEKFSPNEYIILKDQNNLSHSAIGRYSPIKQTIVPLISFSEGVWGIQPRNVEQSFALDALLNDDISFVTLSGKAGTGKTLLALATGLCKTLEHKQFQKLLVSRPIFPMGRDIGYLPGDVEQKLNPWMQPIFDNVEFLLGSDKRAGERAKELMYQGMISIEPLTYIRGRNIPNQYLIVDEAQNLTPHEVKTIVTRAGNGTKVVLTGDPYQIDNPYVDSANSGLTHSVEKFRGEDLAGHITLEKGERSPLAELAANIL